MSSIFWVQLHSSRSQSRYFGFHETAYSNLCDNSDRKSSKGCLHGMQTMPFCTHELEAGLCIARGRSTPYPPTQGSDPPPPRTSLKRRPGWKYKWNFFTCRLNVFSNRGGFCFIFFNQKKILGAIDAFILLYRTTTPSFPRLNFPGFVC